MKLIQENAPKTLKAHTEIKYQGLPTIGLVLDLLDEEALLFYQSFNFFVECSNNPMRLYISRKELEKI